ncbi:hypothetical protein ACIOMM_10175 [Streptomyces sp. NPDC087908]|uniref:hypothetical protein n=1 Tax=unclassified Streptomyces TaxID=2593676 RepID=UPI0011CE7A31|nr:hypothetical protein [Streptomyces sp. adm13(2018)]TXS11093.1 hypothetical protein EAO70_29395 [Streptomyces sp. adm13(2018)]
MVNRRPRPHGNTGLFVGLKVYESSHDMVGVVAGFDPGGIVRLVRPTGYEWTAPWTRVRPAGERERRQLAALAKLHRTRCAGLAA